MRILFLSNTVPYPLHGGASLRLFHLISRVARRHEVILGAHLFSDADRGNAEYLTRHHFPTVAGPLSRFNASHILPSLGYAMRGVPPETAQFSSPVLRRLVREGNYDIIQADETLMAPYLEEIPAGSGARSVVCFHNVHFVQTRRIAALEPSRLWRGVRSFNARWMASYEPRLVRRCSRAIAVSEVDRALLLEAAPGARVDVLPNGVDTHALRPLPAPAGPPAVLFVGSMGYLPCSDGAQWFLQSVFPLLCRRFPGMECWIVGRDAPRSLTALASERVHITGKVDDLLPYYRRATVAIAPLRAGGGSRLKILEAMALGRPMVSTAIGAEGLNLVDGREFLLADTEEAFAGAVAELVENPLRAASVAGEARRRVESEFDWDRIAARQLEIYEELRLAPVTVAGRE